MKTKWGFPRGLFAAVVAIMLATVGIAAADHGFQDVPGGMFYSEAVEWAAETGVTTGTSATTFEPDRHVTRGENITFAYRYDHLIVQPALKEINEALDDTYTKAETDAAILDEIDDLAFDQGVKGDKGDTGPAGPEGPEGPEGLPGPQGDPGVLGVYTAEAWVPVPFPGLTDGRAYCDAGDLVSGGGYHMLDAFGADVTHPVIASSPDRAGEFWHVDVDNQFGSALLMVVFAQCLDMTP